MILLWVTVDTHIKVITHMGIGMVLSSVLYSLLLFWVIVVLLWLKGDTPMGNS